MAEMAQALQSFLADEEDEPTQVLPRGVRLAVQVMGRAQQVHQQLGPGLERDFYSRALAIELEAAGIAFQHDVELPILFRGEELGTRRIDFLLDDLGVAVLTTPIRTLQLEGVRTLLRGIQAGAGLLLNFGAARLEMKRLQIEPARS